MSLDDHLPVISAAISEYGKGTGIKKITPVAGGSINHAYHVETNKGIFFAKINDSVRFPGMFEAERKGLDELSSTKTFRIPKIFLTTISGTHAVILMEFISGGK